MRVTRTSRLKPIAITVTLDTRIVQGRVSEAEFAEWVQQAIEHYHCFRAGYVGIGMKGGITCPDVMLES